MSSVAFLGPQNATKSLVVAASPQTPIGELTMLPQITSWVSKDVLLRPLVLMARGKEERRVVGKEGRQKLSRRHCNNLFESPLLIPVGR